MVKASATCYVLAAWINFERRDIFLAAVFLWIIRFLAALSMLDLAAFNLVSAASGDPALADKRTSLVRCFILVFTALLRIRRFSFWRERFSADL
jgi:hypothetical protein